MLLVSVALRVPPERAGGAAALRRPRPGAGRPHRDRRGHRGLDRRVDRRRAHRDCSSPSASTSTPQAAEEAINTIEPWLVVLPIVVLAPIAEEIFFRGIVFNALLREAGPRWAFLGSATLFAIVHASVVAFVPILLLGLALAWVYRRTQSLLAAIVVHATFNGMSVLLALLQRYEVIGLPSSPRW